MKKTIFTGSGVAIVTPFTEDNQINYDVLGKLIDFQIENGTDAIIIAGTTGESSTLSDQEHRDVIDFAVKHTAKRIPVVAGTGSNDTAYAVQLSQEAEALGVDGLLVVTPYYNKASQSGLIAHYTRIADSVNTPIILYNVPGRTGCSISPDTYSVLADHPNITAIKEACGNISTIAKISAVTSGRLDLYSGNDDQIVPLMSLGGKGVISVMANVIPRQTHDICASYLAGDVTTARELQLRYLDLADKLFIDVSPIPVKSALNLMGWNVGSCRLPLTPLSSDHTAILKASMDAAGLL